MSDEAWVLEALRLTAGEPSGSVTHQVRDGVLKVFMQCSDVFWWGCADCEEITEETLPVLAQARADLVAAGQEDAAELPELYAARIRGMRPQGAWYKYVDEYLWELFNACGPHREAQLGNPTATPEVAP